MTEQQKQGIDPTEEPIKYAVMNEDVKSLCKAFFDVELYPTQVEIVRTIAFQKEKNIVINAYTRYGKTASVGWGIALYLILDGGNLDNFRIGIVGPADSDAESVRKEMLKAGIKSDEFKAMLDTSRSNDPEDLIKSRSKDELTLCDGNIGIELVSSQSGKSGDGAGARGKGYDIIIMDESNRISHSFWKESGDRLREHEDSILVEMGNPFHKDNQFYSHWTRSDFKKFHVGEEKGIEEDRHSKEWFDSRAKEVGGRQSLEYQVLYKSEFPDQVDDALIAHSWLERAEKNSFEFEDPEIIYSQDIAGEGSDKIVLSRLEKEQGKSRLTNQWSEAKSNDTRKTAIWAANIIWKIEIEERDVKKPKSIQDFTVEYMEEIEEMYKERMSDNEKDDIAEFVSKAVIDAIGIGAGVHSKLQELGFDAVKFKAGEKPESEEDRFQNKKARNFFKLRDVLQENDLELVDGFRHGRGNNLVHELTHIKTERRARDKVRIVDPDSGSPDFADSLMMCMYEGSEMWIL